MLELNVERLNDRHARSSKWIGMFRYLARRKQERLSNLTQTKLKPSMYQPSTEQKLQLLDHYPSCIQRVSTTGPDLSLLYDITLWTASPYVWLSFSDLLEITNLELSLDSDRREVSWNIKIHPS